MRAVPCWQPSWRGWTQACFNECAGNIPSNPLNQRCLLLKAVSQLYTVDWECKFCEIQKFVEINNFFTNFKTVGHEFSVYGQQFVSSRSTVSALSVDVSARCCAERGISYNNWRPDRWTPLNVYSYELHSERHTPSQPLTPMHLTVNISSVTVTNRAVRTGRVVSFLEI